MTYLRRGLVALLSMTLVTACSDESPTPITLIPPTHATVLAPDTGPPDGGSGNTTPDEQTNSCSDLSRAYFAAVGADGPDTVLQPLYDAVTPLLPERARADWERAAPALIAYEAAAFTVPAGDDQLADPTVKAAYDEATSADVQDALQRVRDAIDAECPGFID